MDGAKEACGWRRNMRQSSKQARYRKKRTTRRLVVVVVAGGSRRRGVLLPLVQCHIFLQGEEPFYFAADGGRIYVRTNCE